MESEPAGGFPRAQEFAAARIALGEVGAQPFGQGGKGLVVERVQQRRGEAMLAHDRDLLVDHSYRARLPSSVASLVAGVDDRG
ncbi:MAG: hypothetical protein MSC31_02960 [Solirubrobacteraceae bacterium MAG38_C4-C5]|nr:hypothetical protein [Candidatus Siliceabacter maunaloa]